MRINCEEVFGPVVSTVRVKDYEEALEIANRGEFGLSAGHRHELAEACAPLPPQHPRRDGDGQPADGRASIITCRSAAPANPSYGAREQGFAAVEYYTQIKTVYVGG